MRKTFIVLAGLVALVAGSIFIGWLCRALFHSPDVILGMSSLMGLGWGYTIALIGLILWED